MLRVAIDFAGESTSGFGNFREGWYKNLTEITTSGDFEVTFHLKRPQPAFIALLASQKAMPLTAQYFSFAAGAYP